MSHLTGDFLIFVFLIFCIDAILLFQHKISSVTYKSIVVVAILALINIFQFYSKTPEMCIIFRTLSYIIWSFYLPVIFKSAISKSTTFSPSMNKIIIYIIYLISAIFLTVYVVNQFGELSLESLKIHLIYRTANITDYFYLLFIIFQMLLVIAGYLMISKQIFNYPQNEKHINSLFFFSLLIFSLNLLNFSSISAGSLIVSGVLIAVLVFHMNRTSNLSVDFVDYFINETQQLIVITDNDGYIIKSNLVFNNLFQIADKTAGTHLDNYIPNIFSRIKNIDNPFIFDIYISQTNKSLPILFKSKQINNADSRLIGYILSSEDLKMTDANLNATNRLTLDKNTAIIDFLSIISHQLLTPLSTTSLWINLAKADNNIFSQAIQVIDENTNKQMLLITELLTFTRLQQGKISLKISEVNLNDIINLIIIEIQTKFNIEVTSNYNSENKNIMFDIDKITKILSSIINPDFNFLHDISLINIDVIEDYHQFKITVNYFCRAINLKNTANIFDPFSIDNDKKEINTNILALSISKIYAELHDGTLNACINDDNNQLTIIFTIPGNTSLPTSL